MSLALTKQWHNPIQSGLSFAGRIGKVGLMAQSHQINSTRFTYRTSLFTFGMFGTHLLAEVWILYQSLQRLDLVKSEIIDLMIRMYILPSSMPQSIVMRRSRRNTLISARQWMAVCRVLTYVGGIIFRKRAQAKWSPSGPQVVFKWSPTGPQLVPNWSPTGPQLPNWSPTGLQVVSKQQTATYSYIRYISR